MIIIRQAKRFQQTARRRRLSIQIGRIRDRLEEKTRRDVLRVFRAEFNVIMARWNAGKRDPKELIVAPEFMRRFNRIMVPSTISTIFAGVEFEETLIGITGDSDQSIIRSGLDVSAKAVQAEGAIPDAAEIEPPPSIRVDPSAEMQRSIQAQLRERSVGVWNRIPESMQTRLGNSIKRGITEGDSLDDLAARIRKTLKADARGRSRVIARTETTNAMNFGQQVERDELEIDEKEWVSRIDNRTRGAKRGARFDHLRPDGQVVNNDAPFIVSGERLRWPGDQSGSAGNVIQCRCSGIAHFGD